MKNKYPSEVTIEDLRVDLKSVSKADVVVYWDGEIARELKNRAMIINHKLTMMCKAIYG